MANPISKSVIQLIDRAEARQPLGTDFSPRDWVMPTESGGESLYSNRNDRLNIDFSVQRAAFPEAQTVDPRIIEIAPGSCNERHKHAHESIFFVLEGRGEVMVGENWNSVKKGDLAFVPRWIMHQTRNTSEKNPMRILAVTDFGFTSAILGNYDKRTRLALAGSDASVEN